MLDRAHALLCPAFLLCASLSCAQSYPSRTIRIVVPYPAGGGVDITGRAIAQQLAAAFGVSVIVDNRPGAGGRTRAVNRAPACGM
jgi:tripartite-type tricarboxylate transporter receptor subunit TctC